MTTASAARRRRGAIYPARRALEHAVRIADLRPVRIFELLLPVWQVEVRGQITEGPPYELLDRLMEKGIALGRITTAAELAGFFGLDPTLVDRVLATLSAIGHVARRGESCALTELGQRSIHDGWRYVQKESRHKLYFEGISRRPLLRAHYGSVTMLDAAAIESTAPRFLRLIHCGFTSADVSSLLASPDRDRYNLPPELRVVEVLDSLPTFMPVYLVETVTGAGATYYLAFTQVRGERDILLEEVCNASGRVRRFLAYEARRDARDPAAVWRAWLASIGFPGVVPRRLSSGVLRADLPRTAFDGSAAGRRVVDVGSYWIDGTYFLQLWCQDDGVRRRAVLERGTQSIPRYEQLDQVREHLRLLCTQLQVGGVTIARYETTLRSAAASTSCASWTRSIECAAVECRIELTPLPNSP